MAPAAFTALAMPTICSSDSMEQGPAIMAKLPAAHIGAARFDDRVLRMEEAVGELAGVAYAANGFNRRKGQNLVGGQMQAGFADDADLAVFSCPCMTTARSPRDSRRSLRSVMSVVVAVAFMMMIMVSLRKNKFGYWGGFECLGSISLPPESAAWPCWDPVVSLVRCGRGRSNKKPAAFETAGFVFSLAETFYAVKRVLCVNRQNA